MEGLENYASPYLRGAVFHRMFPGAWVEYDVMPLREAFPKAVHDIPGGAMEAVVCTITLPDGRTFTGAKEIELEEWSRRANKKVPIEQTPENFVKNETKAFGRALRDLGIPQKRDELLTLMKWLAALNGAPAQHVDAQHATVQPDAASDSGDDPVDAGADDGPTPAQLLAQRISRLNGADKAELAKRARDIGVQNVMRCPDDKIDDVEALLATIGLDGAVDTDEEPFW